jgi:hypothetical protein
MTRNKIGLFIRVFRGYKQYRYWPILEPSPNDNRKIFGDKAEKYKQDPPLRLTKKYKYGMNFH